MKDYANFFIILNGVEYYKQFSYPVHLLCFINYIVKFNLNPDTNHFEFVQTSHIFYISFNHKIYNKIKMLCIRCYANFNDMLNIISTVAHLNTCNFVGVHVYIFSVKLF